MTDTDAAGDLGAFYEALLFVAERPLTLAELAEQASVPRPQAEAALATLESDLEAAGRGLRLQRLSDEFQLVTAPEVGERLAGYAAREVARRARGAGHHRLPPTVHPLRGRPRPRRRLRLRHSLAAPPPADR
jgi:chromosome segregation and condensation protein ScpB